jgi:sortase (surface protein transpeptidase)
VIAAAASAVVLAAGGTAAVVAALSDRPAQPVSAAASAAPARGTAVPSAPPAAPTSLEAPTLSRSRPLTLTIPSLEVDRSPLVELGKEPDGTLEVPSDYDRAGWFAPGPAPGQFGPAVLAGHVDSKDGPAVFYRLAELRPGAIVDVARADGRTARFAVDKVERYAKDRFPTVAVYGDSTHRAELRLITCGGRFDARTGHYTDNVVAYAHLL